MNVTFNSDDNPFFGSVPSEEEKQLATPHPQHPLPANLVEGLLPSPMGESGLLVSEIHNRRNDDSSSMNIWRAVRATRAF